MDNTSVGSDGPAETDSGIESSSISGASCDSVAYIRVAIPVLDIQVTILKSNKCCPCVDDFS